MHGEARSLELDQKLFWESDFCCSQEGPDISIGAVIRADGGHVNDERTELVPDVEKLPFPTFMVSMEKVS